MPTQNSAVEEESAESEHAALPLDDAERALNDPWNKVLVEL